MYIGWCWQDFVFARGRKFNNFSGPIPCIVAKSLEKRYGIKTAFASSFGGCHHSCCCWSFSTSFLPASLRYDSFFAGRFHSPQFTLYHRHRINYFLCAHPHPITELVGSWLDGCSENYHPRRRCVVCPPNDYVVTVMSLAEVVDEEEEEAGDYGDGVGRRHRYTEHQGEKK